MRQMREKQLAAKRKREIRSSYRHVASHGSTWPAHSSFSFPSHPLSMLWHAHSCAHS